MTVCTQHPTRWTRCDVWRVLQEQAITEWAEAEELGDVRACWGRLGGKVTLHRHGHQHFSMMGKRSAQARRGVRA